MRTNVIFDVQKDTVIISEVGLVRKQNEDDRGYAPTPNGDVFVVCDGMGGHVGGQEASKLAVESIIKYFSADKYKDIYEAIAQAIRYANKNIYEAAQKNPELKGMGTTVVLVVIQEDKVYIGHVGDSRIYLLSDNQLYRLTQDHSYVQELFNRGILTNEEMQHHSRKNEITKALGLKPDVEPEVPNEPILLKNGDKLLLCSDGLSDMVDDITIREVLNKHDNVKSAAQELLNLALTNGGKDNITLQIINISNSNYKETVFVDKSNAELSYNKENTIEKGQPVQEPELNHTQKTDIKSIINNIKKDPKKLAGIVGLVLLLFGLTWLLLGKIGNEENEKTKAASSKKTEKVYFTKIDTIKIKKKDLAETYQDNDSTLYLIFNKDKNIYIKLDDTIKKGYTIKENDNIIKVTLSNSIKESDDYFKKTKKGYKLKKGKLDGKITDQKGKSKNTESKKQPEKQNKQGNKKPDEDEIIKEILNRKKNNKNIYKYTNKELFYNVEVLKGRSFTFSTIDKLVGVIVNETWSNVKNLYEGDKKNYKAKIKEYNKAYLEKLEKYLDQKNKIKPEDTIFDKDFIIYKK